MKKNILFLLIVVSSLNLPSISQAQQSVARKWNEALLEAIREDLARPTVHARNLFHTSVLMYDSWAVYDEVADTYFLGKTMNGYSCPLGEFSNSSDIKAAREETISYGAYRLLKYRFRNSPGSERTLAYFDSLMLDLGYDTSFASVDYSNGSPAALGNYLAQNIINYGLVDGSNEQDSYANQYYFPVNPSLIPTRPGSQNILDPNRWQPLTFELFIDQSGNEFPFLTPNFLSPEWGEVYPFALNDSELSIFNRDGYDYWVYYDPGQPPLLDTVDFAGNSDEYKWTFSFVAIWSSHLDPTDSVMWDISPASIGNIENFPETLKDYHDFYDVLNGGDPGKGHDINPRTGKPYEPQIVPRGDYTRVLAEFWADGPNSETPPGHWFTILNYVNDHPQLIKKFNGKGSVLDDLEWDVKAYFILGGAVHDAAISSWGIKGWYDSIRPISAIRFMADHGQSSDPEGPSYSPSGIPLEDGIIEVVKEGDPLVLQDSAAIGKIKLRAWKGPEYIEDPETEVAGVDWILAENWWPYQRPTFITPPFAGYISGHSTYSRAGAEVLTLLTGDEYFPGGMGVFDAPKNEFLVFEDGPSVDVELQWATYRDASDQCSLSRIWGGIHPPADDIPGRKIGEKIGVQSFHFAENYFNGLVNVKNHDEQISDEYILFQNYPNPFNSQTNIEFFLHKPGTVQIILYDVLGQEISRLVDSKMNSGKNNVRWNGIDNNGNNVASGIYFYKLIAENLDGTGSYTDIKKLMLIK